MVRFPEPIVQPMREAPQLDEKRIDLVALAVCSARTASQAHEAMVWGPLVPLANIELDFQLPSPSPVEARVRKQSSFLLVRNVGTPCSMHVCVCTF